MLCAMLGDTCIATPLYKHNALVGECNPQGICTKYVQIKGGLTNAFGKYPDGIMNPPWPSGFERPK